MKTAAQAEANKRYIDSPKGQRVRAEWVKANKERLAQYHKNWVKRNKPKMAAVLAKWRRNNPDKYNAQHNRWSAANKEKIRAYRKMRKALKTGLLIRPKICSNCGKKARIDAHHHKGYEHPLEVLWLCRQCHVDQHPER